VGAFKKFFDDWKNSAGGDNKRSSQPTSDIGAMIGRWDPWPNGIKLS
jgi:hypothetical protein